MVSETGDCCLANHRACDGQWVYCSYTNSQTQPRSTCSVFRAVRTRSERYQPAIFIGLHWSSANSGPAAARLESLLLCLVFAGTCGVLLWGKGLAVEIHTSGAVATVTMFHDESGGRCGDSTAAAVVRQDEAVTRLSHKKMLRRVRSGTAWHDPRTNRVVYQQPGLALLPVSPVLPPLTAPFVDKFTYKV